MNAAGLVLCLFGLPETSSLDVFPDKEFAEARYEWLKQHVEWVNAQRKLDRVNVQFWQDWFEEADSAKVVWRNLVKCRECSTDEYYTRHGIEELRQRLGDAAFASGRMPFVDLEGSGVYREATIVLQLVSLSHDRCFLREESRSHRCSAEV